MRIVGGKHRGRRLDAPPGQAVRPTADRTRESLFNLLEQGRVAVDAGFTLSGARVLDAFCGTGALGLEARSRGAGAITFLDKDRQVLDGARANAQALGESDETTYVRGDATRPPRAPRPHDLVLLDPPYGDRSAAPALVALAEAGWIGDAALIVVECASGDDAFAMPDGFEELDRRRYGAATLIFLRPRTP